MNGSTEWKSSSDFSFVKERWNHCHYQKGKNKAMLSKKRRKKGHGRLKRLPRPNPAPASGEQPLPRTAAIRIMPSMCARRWSGLWLLTAAWPHVHTANICMPLSLFMLMLASGGFSQNFTFRSQDCLQNKKSWRSSECSLFGFWYIPTQEWPHSDKEGLEWSGQESPMTMSKCAAFLCFN